MMRGITIVIALLFLTGCRTQRNRSQNISDSGEKDTLIINPPYLSTNTSGTKDPLKPSNYIKVKTFYGTDRNLVREGVGAYYGIDRGQSTISYGTCEVSIPRNHRIGVLESPLIYNLELSEDPNKHIVILSVNPKAKGNYFSEINDNILKSESSAFIFIHGFNVSFGQAAKTTAQICYDLGFKGVPVFYSWPSQVSETKYMIDEVNNEWATNNLKNFLHDFALSAKANDIFLIAHSMGNRCLTRAVTNLVSEHPHLKRRFKGIILTAPDIDADVFKRDIAPVLINAGQRITMYVSSDDLALQLSKSVHGYQRAGDAGNNISIVKGIETVDATNVNTEFLGHSYATTSRSVLDDIFYIIHNDLGADKRNLIKINTKTGYYWKFRQ